MTKLSPDISIPNTPPKVAVIVLTWNGKQLTLDCLASLTQVTWPNTEIIVVDNASTDGTVDAVTSAYGDHVKVITNTSNMGFARGNNVGIDFALKGGADYILLLNNDTVVDPEFVTHLFSAISASPDLGIAGPKIYYFTPSDTIWFAGGEVFLWRGGARHRGIREKDTGRYNDPCDVDYVTGCALMVKREVIERIGKLDPSYRAYFEDTDFCMRAKKAGYRSRYAPDGKVWHKISQSTGGQVSMQKIKTKLGSTLRFLRHHARPHHWLTIPFFFIADVIRILFMILFGKIRDTKEETS